MNSDSIARIIQPICEARSEIELVYLFGSQVTGNTGPMSDIDLGVVLKPGHDDFSSLAAITHELSKALQPGLVQVLSLRKAPIDLVFAIISKGVLLYQSGLVERVEFEAQVLSRHADYLPVLRAQQEDIIQGGEDARRTQRYREALRRIERTLSQIKTAH